MRLTLAKAKEELAARAPAGKLEERINRAVERLLLNGKFAGSLHTLALTARFGQITLPYQYRTIEGVMVNGVVYDIVNHWWQFLQGKSTTQGFSMSTVRDLGDGWPILYDLPSGGNIVVSYPTSGEEQRITIFGTDSDGFPLQMLFTGAGTQANSFSQIDRIHKENVDSPSAVKINHIASDSTVTPLAWFDPKQEESYYRRYIIDTMTGTAETTIVALAKLRYIPLLKNDDVLPIHNLSALDLAMTAVQYYNENDITLGDDYMDRAVDLLNKELGDTNADTVPTIRFHNVGGSPRLTSHY